uniref:GtrA family protein n=1 Tax=Nocardia miyunensis TaxID=282684 RepID=UPI000A514356
EGVWRVSKGLAKGTLPVNELRAAIGREPLVDGVPLGMVGQLVRFGIIGVISTLAYMLLYLVLQPFTGPQAANFLALLITAVGNTAANRAFTFGVRGSANAVSHQAQGLLIFAFTWFLTSGSLFALHHWAAGAAVHLELFVLVVANLVATLIRFVALRWVFRDAVPAAAIRNEQVASEMAAAEMAAPSADTSEMALASQGERLYAE